MSDQPEITDEQKQGTSVILQNIANLIKSGLFVGSNAAAVVEATQWLQTGASFMSRPNVEPTPEPVVETPLTLVPNEEKVADGQE